MKLLYTDLIKQSKILYVLLITLVLTSCAIRLIAPYDEVTDRKVSDLQEKVVTKMIEWEREIPPIAEEYPFYDQTQSVLEILILRNENIEKSKIIVSSLQKLLDNIIILKSAHESNMLNTAFIRQVKPDIMAQFNAIQTFQMALKKAEEK
jgi:hypothetical protein